MIFKLDLEKMGLTKEEWEKATEEEQNKFLSEQFAFVNINPFEAINCNHIKGYIRCVKKEGILPEVICSEIHKMDSLIKFKPCDFKEQEEVKE